MTPASSPQKPVGAVVVEAALPLQQAVEAAAGADRTTLACDSGLTYLSIDLHLAR